MTTIVGNNGTVTVGAVTIAEVLSFALNQAGKVAPDTVLTDEWDTHKPGTKSWGGSVSCYRDKTDATGQGALVVGGSVDLHLLEEGPGAGNIDYNGTVTITAIESSTANDVTTPINFTFVGNGALTEDTLV